MTAEKARQIAREYNGFAVANYLGHAGHGHKADAN